MSAKHQARVGSWDVCRRGEELHKRDENEKTQTPRLLAPACAPGETGVGRPDGRKPESGEGAGPGSGGVTGNPVAKSERGNTKDT